MTSTQWYVAHLEDVQHITDEADGENYLIYIAVHTFKQRIGK